MYLPRIDEPCGLADCLGGLGKDYPDAQLLLGSLSDEAEPVISEPLSGSAVVAFVGPEGDLSDDERELLSERGVKSVRITETILRVETAAVAFATILTARCEAGQ